MSVAGETSDWEQGKSDFRLLSERAISGPQKANGYNE